MLLSMIPADYGVTLASEATSRITMSRVAFIPILDEPEPITFGAVWSPHNSAKAVRGLLDIARTRHDLAGSDSSPHLGETAIRGDEPL